MITVNGIEVQVVRKDIKNLHLAVYPPDGRVRVAVPRHITDDNVRLAIVSSLRWIKKQQKDFAGQPRQSERKYVSGECYYFLGRRYRLQLIERVGKHEIKLLKSGRLKMFVNPSTSVINKEILLYAWYREELKKLVPSLLEKWQPIVGKKTSDWNVRKMKTKWGSCNYKAHTIRLNTELVKKPAECLEYIIVHELVHLLERNHNDKFIVLMNRFMPKWRAHRDELNSLPVSHTDWGY